MNEQELKQWERRIRDDERAYLVQLLAAIRDGECDELLAERPSVAESMARAERLKADNEFLKSLGIEALS